MFNLRGQHQYLYQQNMKVAVPVLVSTRGYGVFVDCTSLMTFHDDAFGSYLWSDVDEELDYYFIVGPEFDDIVAELRALTGQAADAADAGPSATSSRRSATRRQDELLAVAREYRDAGCRSTASCSTGSRGPATCGARSRSIPSASRTPTA